MTLAPGTRLSYYEILESIGVGGMGEVYKALDTKLGREVAIKVLPEAFAESKERLGRFEREAKLLASLNHPNIATLFDLEEGGGTHFLVLELVPGETLAERGRIPVDEALPVFKQIAEALEAAHEKGIIHRDLKPANIKITPEGRVKVLDFGLAKAMQPEEPVADASQSPTLTKNTALGAIMGTAAYMSPEQARGKPVDKQTDIWAFGCCLFEALTGRPAFTGESVTDILAAVVKSEPDWDVLPQAAPRKVRELTRRCLRKDRAKRLHDVADARLDIEEAIDEPEVSPVEPTPRRGLSFRYVVVAAVAAIVTALVFWSMTRSTPVPQSRGRFSISLPDEAPVDIRGFPSLALSPVGTKLVYVVQRDDFSQLYIRDMEKFEAEPIPGTEGGVYPFFSPDGEWIGYFDIFANKLKKVWIHGGAPVDICETNFGRGASWHIDDTLVFSTTEGIYKVPASGGSQQIVTNPDREKGVTVTRYPQILPDGEYVLFMFGTSTISSYDDATIAVVSLQSGEQKTLIEGGSRPHYLPTGHIVYARAGSLMAVPFDPDRLEVTGAPIEVLEGIATDTVMGNALFSFSMNGTLVYVPGGPDVDFRRILSVDRTGDVRPIPVAPSPYWSVRVSPDGQWLALEVGGANNHIWLFELERETLTRLTSSWGHQKPRWTPDGHRVTFTSNQSGVPEIFWKPVDGSGPEERIHSGEYAQHPNSWSPNGKMLAYREWHPLTGTDIWLLSMDGERRVQPFLVTEFSEWGAEFSPDGRWLAYCSDETGRFEVYVRPISGTGRRIQISTDGGDQPGWAPDSREIFYRQNEKMMSVAVGTGEELVAGKPEMLFEIERDMSVPFRTYGITPDGRFVMIQPLHESTSKQIHVVLNWFDELKQLVPTN